MADFTININAKVDTPYQAAFSSYSKAGNCFGFITSYTTTITSGASSTNVGLLAPWKLPTLGLVLDTLYIKNIQYTDGNKLWYEYNGTKLLEGGDYVIDITGSIYTDTIALLTIEEEQPPNSVNTLEVSCDIALEDSSNLRYEYRQSKLTILYSEC